MPLAWCVLQLALQGAAATLYLKLRFDGSKAAPLMHAVVIVAITTLALLPFVPGVARWPSNRRRFAFALVMGTMQLGVLLFHGLTLLAYTQWQSPFALELVGAYAPHVPTLLRGAGIAPAAAAMSCGLVAVLVVLAYWGCSGTVLRGLATLVTWAGGSSPRRGRRRIVGVAMAGYAALACVYLPTRSLWMTREPLHISLNSDWSQGQLAPIALFVNYSTGRREPLPRPPAGTSRHRRTLVLVMVDALRSDRMQVYGAARENTPFLAELTRAGTLHRFDRAYSVCTVSFCGILGTLGSRYWHQLVEPPVTVTDVLAQHGYHSRFVLGGDHSRFSILKPLYGPRIDHYTDGGDLDGAYPNDDAALLATLRHAPPPADQPLFLYVHLMSVHALGTRHAAYSRWRPDRVALLEGWRDPARRAQAYRNRYDNGILQADAMIRELFGWLREQGRLDDALVVITADHGEALGEDGQFAHGGAPVDAMVRVPLLVYDAGPGTYPDRELTSQVDIAPTLLHGIGAPIPPSFGGVPLQLETRGRPVFVASQHISGVVGVASGEALKHLVRVDGTREGLFRVNGDSADARDLSSDAAYARALASLRALHPSRP